MATKVKPYYKNQKVGKGWMSDAPSLTVVGETWTIQELVEKYASGQIQAETNASYLDVENFDAINEVFRKHLDLTDLDKFTAQVKLMQATVEAQLAQQETVTPTAEEEVNIDSKEVES